MPHDFNAQNKDTSKQPTETKVVNMKQHTAKNLLETTSDIVRQFASVTKRILMERFGMVCDFTEKELDGNYTYHLFKKGVKEEVEGQIRVTVTTDCIFKIQLNPYDHYGEYYFQARDMDTKELTAEFDNFGRFLEKGEFSEHGKFEKVVNYDPNEIDDLLAEYEGGKDEKKPE